MESDAETNTRFEAHVRPVREALARLLDVSDELRESRGSLPDADSRAMAELAIEHEFKRPSPWGDDPVHSAHNQAQLLLYAASDCARGAIRLLSSSETTVFGHVVLARSALEHAGRGWTLLDSTISTPLRVARVMNERIYSLAEQIRLPIPDAETERARRRRSGLIAAGESLNLKRVRANRRTPATLEEERMGQTLLVRTLLQSSQDSKLGKMVYGYYSAVAHGTAYGLSQSITLDAPGKPATPGVTWGAIYTDSGSVVSVLASMILGLGAAYGARNELFGWRSAGWDAAYAHAVAAVKQALPG